MISGRRIDQLVALSRRRESHLLYGNIGTRRQGSHPMKALVYHGPGQKAWEHVPDPKIIHPTDVIVRVDITTICGTDLHILKGDVPAVTDGRILGHEGAGTIPEIGQAGRTTAGLYGASPIIAIDLDDNRVQQARGFGATDGVNSGDAGWRDEVLAMTDGLGVDVAIEAVGMSATFQMATELIRPGGTVANVGVHGKPVEL